MRLESFDILLTCEAARIIGVTPATVRQMERRGILPARRTETGVRIFDRHAVEQFAHERSGQLKPVTEGSR